MYVLGASYFIEKRGETSCSKGSKIMTVQACKLACVALGKVAARLKPDKECYIAGNGKCRQDGKRGPKTSLVCVSEGNIQIYLYVQNKFELTKIL